MPFYKNSDFHSAINHGAGMVFVKGGSNLLLDLYPSAAGAWSASRQLDPDQVSAMDVRESGGDTEETIDYSGGVLDEAALLSHCGSNDGLVTKLHDHSGNEIDMSQSTAAAQPKIVSSGAVEKVNGKPAIVFDGSDDFLTTGGLTISATGDNYVAVMYSVGILTASTVTVSENTVMLSLAPGSISGGREHIQQSFEDTAVAARLQGGNTVFDAGDGKTQSVFMMGHLATDSEFVGRLDGSALSVSSSGANDDLSIRADSGYMIGVGGSPTYTGGGTIRFFEGKFQEGGVWESDVWSDASGIESNVNDHYSTF